MVDYPTTRALRFKTLQALIDDLYSYDSAQYTNLKKNEGQYAYFEYVQKVRRATDNIFYKRLRGRPKSIANLIKSSSRLRHSNTCIVLNNNSLLGHVTVLRSMGYWLQKYAQTGKITVVALMKGTNEQEVKWKKALREAGLHVADLSKSNLHDRFIEADSSLKPRQYIWWGWPPGQWIGPLLASNAIHRSFSFKYDFPAAERFLSHHIGYGDKYASNIADICQIYGFTQHFSTDLIPSFSQAKKEQSLRTRSSQNKLFAEKKIIHLGTLGRSEKIAQKPFLEAVKNILIRDKRVVFHWTGKEKSQSIVEYFDKYDLSKRNMFHGWVHPYEYLKELDMYLDTFPFGTGETFVLAGLMGIPLVAMDSPYEANFTNLLTNSPKSPSFISSNSIEYCSKVNNFLCGIEQYCHHSLSAFFEEIFAPGSLTCSKQTAIFAKQLDL